MLAKKLLAIQRNLANAKSKNWHERYIKIEGKITILLDGCRDKIHQKLQHIDI